MTYQHSCYDLSLRQTDHFKANYKFLPGKEKHLCKQVKVTLFNQDAINWGRKLSHANKS